MKTLWIVGPVLTLLLLAGCLPTAKEQSCSGGSVFNPTTRDCVPLTSGGNTSGISIATRSPMTSVIPVGITETNQYNFAVTVNNPLNESYAISWRFYPPSGTVFSGNPLTINSPTYSFIPAFVAGLTAGTWTLAAEVYNGNGTLLLQSATWSIVVGGGGQPNLTINTAASDLDTNIGNRVTTDHSLLTLAVDINNPAGSVATRLYWFYDGVAQGAFTSHAGPTGGVTKTFYGTAVDTPAGVHSIRAELRNSTGTTIINTIEWTIYVTAPNLPQLSTTTPPAPDTSVTISAINSVALNANGFSSGGNDLFTTPNSDFCVAVTNHLGTLGAAGGVTAQFKYKGVNLGLPQNFTAANSYVCLGDFMPTFAATLTNPTVGEFQTVSAQIVDVGTATQLALVNWSLSVRVQNTAPVALIGSPTSPVSVQQGGNPTATSFVMNVSDVDTIASNMSVYFFFDGVAMNGVNKFPGTSITTPDCTHPVGSGPAAAPARYTCSFTLPAFSLTGRINPPGAYTITGYVVDQTVYGGAPQSSGIVTWTVNPTLGQSSPVVAAQGVSIATPTNCDVLTVPTCTPATATGNSYIAQLVSPTTPTVGPIAEGTNVIFNALINDSERDNISMRIDRCLDAGCTTLSAVANDFIVNRSNDNLGRRGTFSYRLPEDLIEGAASGNVTFRISVQDKLPDNSLSPATPVTTDLTIAVTNFNPFPVWAGAASANPAPSDVLSVVTGMPLTIDPGTITDASTADGNVIEYQWEISRDAGTTWQSITGATSRVLKFTPSNNVAGTTLQLRLCVGDDGFGNELTNCTGIASPVNPSAVVGPWTSVTARSNAVAKDATTPTLNGDGAAWFDAESRAHYMAYINNNGTDDATIVIEKYTIANNGSMSLDSVVSFASEETAPGYDAARLSLVGQSITTGGKTYKNLYVAYVTQSSSAGINPRVRIRQIDITDDLFFFDYHGISESDTTTDNITTTRAAAGNIALTVANSVFDAGEVVYINGIGLTATTGAPTACQFQSFAANSAANRDAVAASLFNQYAACSASITDAREFTPLPNTLATAVSGSVWSFTNFPQNWIDVGNSLFLGKVGDIHLQSNYVLIPYLDNVNGGRVSVSVINTLAGFASGSLGGTAGPSWTAGVTNVNVNTTVQGQDIASSHNGSANFDVAITNATSGVNAYRLTFTAPSTIAVTGSELNIFGTSLFARRPRIASGSATTNNNIFVLAEDLSDPNKELLYARIDGATYDLAASMPVTPLSSEHEQSRNLTEYKIRALSTNKNVAMAVLTTSGKVLVSVLRPEVPSVDFPEFYPEDTSLATDGAGFTYPAVATGVAITTPTLAMSVPQSFELGDSGAVASENAKESFVLLHPSTAATFFSQSFVNIATEAISATSATAASQTNGFQPGFIK